MLLFHSDTTASGFERDLRNLPPPPPQNPLTTLSVVHLTLQART